MTPDSKTAARAVAVTTRAEDAHGMKPVAVVFAIANGVVLALFVGLALTGWLEFGTSAVAATAG